MTRRLWTLGLVVSCASATSSDGAFDTRSSELELDDTTGVQVEGMTESVDALRVRSQQPVGSPEHVSLVHSTGVVFGGLPVGPFPFGHLKAVDTYVPFFFEVPVRDDMDRCWLIGPTARPIDVPLLLGKAQVTLPGLPSGVVRSLQMYCQNDDVPWEVHYNDAVSVNVQNTPQLGPIFIEEAPGDVMSLGRFYRFGAVASGGDFQRCWAVVKMNDYSFEAPAFLIDGVVTYFAGPWSGAQLVSLYCNTGFESVISTSLDLPPTSADPESARNDRVAPSALLQLFTDPPLKVGGPPPYISAEFSDNVGVLGCSLDIEDLSTPRDPARGRKVLRYTKPLNGETSGRVDFFLPFAPTIDGLFWRGEQLAVGATLTCFDAAGNNSVPAAQVRWPFVR